MKAFLPAKKRNVLVCWFSNLFGYHGYVSDNHCIPLKAHACIHDGSTLSIPPWGNGSRGQREGRVDSTKSVVRFLSISQEKLTLHPFHNEKLKFMILLINWEWIDYR